VVGQNDLAVGLFGQVAAQQHPLENAIVVDHRQASGVAAAQRDACTISSMLMSGVSVAAPRLVATARCAPNRRMIESRLSHQYSLPSR
jgi:hypothetical protein